MAEPQPTEPADGSTKPAESERPAWLVGAEEGVEAELSRASSSEAAFELRRPQANLEEPASRPERPRPRIVRPDGAEPTPAAEASQAKVVPWKAAGSSVPRLRSVPSSDAVTTGAELSRRVGGVHSDEDSLAAGFPMPTRDGFATAEQQGENPSAGAAAGATRGPALEALREPWWLIAIERLATDRRIQIGIAAGLAVVIALVVFWPRSEEGISLSQLKRHPERFEGQSIRVHGRVGDVFAVGQGHAFNLHQGRDTVVIYTRTRIPAPRERVTVVGSVSTGYLDGIARVAVFETP